MSTPTVDDRKLEHPVEIPPAPWRGQASAITWWQRPGLRARAGLRDVLPAGFGADPQVLMTAGMMLSYTDTPVGPYREVLGLVLLRRGLGVIAHVPFIAVDSAASVAAGRANWGLPKTLATFDGSPSSQTAMHAAGADWRIDVTPRAYGPALPLAFPPVGELVQTSTDDGLIAARVSAYGTGRIARITVESDIAEWFPTGTFTGILSQRVVGHLPATHSYPADGANS